MGPPLSFRHGLGVLLTLIAAISSLVKAQNVQFNQFNNGRSNYERPAENFYPQVPNSYSKFLETLMYPYDAMDRAPFDASKIEHEMALGIRLPFFGFSYTYIKVHMHGYVHFGGSPREYRLPIEFPLKPLDTVSEKDPAVIAPWLTFQSLLGETPESGIYTRLIMVKKRSELERCEKQNPALDRNLCWLQLRIHDDFNGGMIGSQGFVPKFALIVTWRNMTVPQMERIAHTQKSNTYQVVIASDETTSYAMFNYDQIEWISSEDRKGGNNGLNPFIGFNAGNTTRAYEFFPYSQQPRVSQLTEGGSEKMKGRYIFQIDEEIYTGTCIDWASDPHLIKQRPRLSFFPKFANMLGGTMINITGPCFPRNAKIECQFQDMSGGRFPAIYRDRNHVSCYMPPVFFHGYVDLTVTVNNGDALFYGRFYIQPPELAHVDVTVLNNAYNEEKPHEFYIQWTREKLTWNVNDSKSVSVHLWGFEDNKEYPSLTYITKLAEAPLNQMTLALPLEEYARNNNRDLLNLQFGFISVNFTADNGGYTDEKSPVIWSRPMPLSWYFWPQWEYNFGQYWKDQFCHDWFQREREGDKFAISLWRCPCTMRQSELDRGRYAPDTQCSVYTRNCDPFYKRALHCVKSGRPSVGGSGQTCCYDMDGELILTADTMYGGKPHRYFSYGVLPYNQRSKVASLATWSADMMPFFSCCHWQAEKDDSSSCQKYKYFRTSQDCSAYQPPGFAAVYGDPHFLTFDGTNYTFGGRGEFSLVRADNEKAKINVQGRFESRRREQFSDITVHGTYLSGVAVRDNVSSTVEIHLRPLAARRFYQLYLLVDNEYIYFWDEKMKTLNFKGVSIYQPTGYYNMSKIVAMFDSGAGVEVSIQHEQLVLHVFLPIEFVNITSGLLGSWDNEADNDVAKDQRGPAVGPGGTATVRQISEFGDRHRLNESASLFNHMMFGYNFGHYDDVNFQPYSPPPGREIEAAPNATMRNRDLTETCATSKACRYDYVVTGSRSFAATTKAVEAAAYSISTEVRKEVIRCQALDKPAYGSKSEIRNFVGKAVQFSCAPGYRLYGHNTRQCKETGLWSWGEPPVCKSVRDHVLAMIGITLGILIPIAIIIACCFLCCKSKSEDKSGVYITEEKGEEHQAFAEKSAYAESKLDD